MAPTNSWRSVYDVALVATSAITLYQSTLFNLKEGLKGTLVGTNGPNGAPPAGSNWSIDYSCDSVTAGTKGDGVDRWPAYTNVVRGASGANAKSWVVLTAPVALGSFQVCICAVGASNGSFEIALSKVGFTGGTNQARPTATDEATGGTSGAYTIADLTVAAGRIHMAKDTTGNAYFLVSRNGVGFFHTLVGFGACLSPPTGDTTPMFVLWDSTASTPGAPQTNVSGVGLFTALGNGLYRSPDNGEGVSGSSAGFACPNTFQGTTKLDINGKLQTVELKMWTTGATHAMWRGILPDLMGTNKAKSVGTTLPAGTPQYFIAGACVIPTDGIAPTL